MAKISSTILAIVLLAVVCAEAGELRGDSHYVHREPVRQSKPYHHGYPVEVLPLHVHHRPARSPVDLENGPLNANVDDADELSANIDADLRNKAGAAKHRKSSTPRAAEISSPSTSSSTPSTSRRPRAHRRRPSSSSTVRSAKASTTVAHSLNVTESTGPSKAPRFFLKKKTATTTTTTATTKSQ